MSSSGSHVVVSKLADVAASGRIIEYIVEIFAQSNCFLQ